MIIIRENRLKYIKLAFVFDISILIISTNCKQRTLYAYKKKSSRTSSIVYSSRSTALYIYRIFLNISLSKYKSRVWFSFKKLSKIGNWYIKRVFFLKKRNQICKNPYSAVQKEKKKFSIQTYHQEWKCSQSANYLGEDACK